MQENEQGDVLRYLTLEEVVLMKPLCEKFWAEGNLPGIFSMEHFQASWKTFIENDIGRIIGCFKNGDLVGALGFIISRDPNNGDLMSTELFWFVDPNHRGRIGFKLWKLYEEIAKAAGVKRIGMAHLQGLNDEKLKTIFIKRGYRPVETHYLKEI